MKIVIALLVSIALLMMLGLNFAMFALNSMVYTDFLKEKNRQQVIEIEPSSTGPHAHTKLNRNAI